MTPFKELVSLGLNVDEERIKKAVKVLRGDEDEKLLTVNQVCEFLQCSRVSLYNHEIEPSYKIGGSNRYYISSVLRQLEEKRNG